MPTPSPLYRDMPFDHILNCVHCGLCLDACPTYRELGTEQDSPRGRLYLMRGLWEGELQPSAEVVAPLERCIDCRACETACPSGVPYGELLEKTRGVLQACTRPSLPGRLASFALERVLPSRRWLVSLSWLGKLARRTGLDRLGGASWLPRFLQRGSRTMPHFEGSSFVASHPEHNPAAVQPARLSVGLFSGCIMDVADHAIHRASLRLLQAAGCDVVLPRAQTCCGALAVHAGRREGARACAERNAAAFEGRLDYIVVDAAGCAAQLKEYAHLFAETAERDDARWQAFGAKVIDIALLLARLPLATDVKAWRSEPLVALYDAPCHLIHAQRGDGPARALLAGLPGLRLVPLAEADRCCGAGGVYNLVQADLADRVLARKLDDLEASLAREPEAKILLTGNPGCLFQLRAGIRERGLPLEVMHPVELMAQRLQN